MPYASGIIHPALEPDGKQVVVTTPARSGWKTWFTGAGDQISPLKRGDGTKLRLSMLGADTQSVEIQFSECVELHDGEAYIDDPTLWSLDDTVDAYLRMPATSTTPNAGAGNCNIVSGALIPAPATDGSDDVDLSAAVPILASANDGYWNVDESTGVVTAVSNPGAPDGNCNLLTSEIKAYLIRRLPIANKMGVLMLDVYKAEWVHPNHRLVIEVNKNSAGAGEFAAWVLMFRENVTES